MKKNLEIPVNIEILHYPGQTVLKVTFERPAVRDWCLGLCLLKEGLIDSLLVSKKGTKKRFELRKSGTLGHKNRTEAHFVGDTVRLTMPMGDLDYVFHFFLGYYRDGVAGVDHIDLQAVSENADDESYITFIVPDSIPPLTAEEAKRRLGIDF